jgi:hypothetical protein
MIKAPKWCSQAVPTPRGWVDPITGELFISKRFSQLEIDEFNNITTEVVEQMYAYAKQEPQMLHEAPVAHVSLESMTKVQLQALCEENGIEYAPRDTKKVLVEKLS